jgi:orotate phosphoribosyltransferase
MKAHRTPAERIRDREQIKAFFRVRQAHKDTEDKLIDMLISAGAILRGHFQLESGLHSQFFFRFADLASRLDYIDFIADQFVADLDGDHIALDAILVQPSAGRLLAQMLNRKLNKEIIIARVNERNQPTGDLVNETDLHPNDRVLIVEDLATTGSSMATMIDSVRNKRARPVAIALFATRNKSKMSEFAEKQNIPLYVLGDLAFEAQTVPQSECKLCAEGEPILSWDV